MPLRRSRPRSLPDPPARGHCRASRLFRWGLGVDLQYSRNHAKWFVSPVLRAIRRYALIEKGDQVCVGFSGGRDSTTLLYILAYLRRYSHLEFGLSAIHVRTSDDYSTAVLRDLCSALEAPYFETSLRLMDHAPAGNMCSICARLKRGAAARVLAEQGIWKLAYGHHADDAAETLLMNVVQNRKLGSFSPKVCVEGCHVTLIRPMIYLDGQTIASVHRYAGLPILDLTCPYAGQNIRREYRSALRLLEGSLGVRSLSLRIVGALENIDETNLWRSLQHQRGEA
jgi:tRNA 2-thiocytidine biosynthesis protein TtcA